MMSDYRIVRSHEWWWRYAVQGYHEGAWQSVDYCLTHRGARRSLNRRQRADAVHWIALEKAR